MYYPHKAVAAFHIQEFCLMSNVIPKNISLVFTAKLGIAFRKSAC